VVFAAKHKIHLLGSGSILCEVLKAAEILKAHGIESCVWSVTSFTELAREAQRLNRKHRFAQHDMTQTSHLTSCLADGKPVLAATDYVAAYAEQIRPYLDQDYCVLGTDGFGRSDTRKALRAFFGIDANSIAYCAVSQLVQQGVVDSALLEQFAKYLPAELALNPLES
tara:strand:+ start:259 stop:762 length:504 start_codon:yes stop_codon:yes gene_type:complete